MRAFIERVQRALIARGDGLNEPDPVLLGYRSLRLVGKEQIAERPTYDPAGGYRRRMDHESGAVQSDDRLRFEQRKKRVNHRADSPLLTTPGSDPHEAFDRPGAGSPPATCLDGPHAGRTTGDRDRILFRADVCRSGGEAESAA